MEMWLKCMVLLCTAYTSVSAPVTFHHLTISGNGPFDVEVCFNRNNNALDGYTFYHLSIFETINGANTAVKAIHLKTPVPASADIICTKQSTGGLTQPELDHIANKTIVWLLTIEEKEDMLQRVDSLSLTASIKTPEALPVSPLSAEIDVIGETGAGEKILKIQEPFSQIFWDNTDLELPACDSGSPSSPCFYKLGLNSANGVSFSNCFKDDDSEDDVPLCGGSTDGKKIETPGERAKTTVIVDCGAATDDPHTASFSAQGGLTFTDAIQTSLVKAITKAPIEIQSCPNAVCPVTEDFKVTLVDYNREVFVDCDIKDRVLDAYELAAGTAIVEVKWGKNLKEYFRMTRLKVPIADDDAEYHSANVDCSLEDGTYCHAYFVDVAVGTHQIQLQELKDWANEPQVENDIWQKTTTTTKPVKTSTLENRTIHARSTAITVTESSIVLDVCFAYITDTFNPNNHYEFLAVNSKGKWKKEIVNKKKDDSHACFHGLEFPLADFSESSKFFVLLRDSNIGKPLASGEVTFDLPAPRAIKPEVDNGSNGSTSTLAIVGAAIAGIACLMALVAAAVMFVMKINKDNDGLQYPLHRNNIEDSSIIHGLENPIPTM